MDFKLPGLKYVYQCICANVFKKIYVSLNKSYIVPGLLCLFPLEPIFPHLLFKSIDNKVYRGAILVFCGSVFPTIRIFRGAIRLFNRRSGALSFSLVISGFRLSLVFLFSYSHLLFKSVENKESLRWPKESV